ncbi:hypothetical protein RvY_13680 [Ramazzottius varieornatus]|uniref:PHD-type domain-containing protein n=1 Tax=Ramazzottius varieornatus TaxID=947166 RepID=A0A1D1VQJ4_RAMVA|nr:hypothetical protein RvY_13680 [Ramazzottius varieornatus]
MTPLASHHGHVQNSNLTSDRVMGAIRALTDSAKLKKQSIAISFEEIEDYIVEEKPDTRLCGGHLKKSILREVDCGHLAQLVNGNFVMADLVDKTMKIRREAASASAQHATSEGKRGKYKKRRHMENIDAGEAEPEEPDMDTIKKFKFTYNGNKPKNGSAKLDLALQRKPHRRNSRPCVECLDEKGFQAAISGELLECVSCIYATHPACGGYSAETTEIQRGNYHCMRCKTCNICDQGSLLDDPNMVVCIRCDNAFHTTCHVPNVSPEKAAKEWRCADCKNSRRLEGKKKFRHGIKTSSYGSRELLDEPSRHNGAPGNSFLSRVPERPIFSGLNTADVVLRAIESFHDSLPPAKTAELVKEIEKWTVEDVARKLGEKNPSAAKDEAIRAQNIDGSALMLLTRDDVVNRFGLPLTAALRLYRDICLICPFGPYTEWK